MLKKVTILVSLIFLILVATVGSVSSLNSTDGILAKVYLTDRQQALKLLTMGFDIIESGGNYVKVFAAPKEILRLEEMGFRIERLDLSEVVDRSVIGKAGAGLYHTYAEVVAELNQIESVHGNIAKVYTIGASIEGRSILAIKISDNPTVEETDEPDVLYMGLHHAREWISVEVPMYLANHLTDNYGSDPNITSLVDERETWIVPIVNPDGLEYSQTVYTMWRKNKRDNNNNGVFDPSYDGVDNNRNYGFKWGYDNIGSSPNPPDETYRGAYAFSEPENRAIRDLALQHNFVFAISFHSYGEQMIFPWGYRDADTPDDKLFNDLGKRMAQFNGYVYGNPKDGIIYNTNGEAADWLYANRSTIAYTFELATSFIPPESQIYSIWLQNKEAALYLLQIANNPHQIYPSVRIYTDKTSYVQGDAMQVSLDIANPGTAVNIGLNIWVDLPSGGMYWVLRKASVTLPVGFNYTNPAWKSYVLPTVPPGSYSWHATVVDPSTNYVLNESVSDWTFSVVV